jgi:hypothetical protein
VCDQETSKNEEAKTRYRAVENKTAMGCNAKKTNKQTNKQTRNNCAQSWFYLQDCKKHFSLCGTKFVVMIDAECSLGISVTTCQIRFHNISKK